MLFETSHQAGRIPLMLVLGKSAAHTRLFTNTLITSQAFADSVVIGVKQEALDPFRHDRVVEIPHLEVSAQDGCLCCGLHGALGDCLRTIFFEALKRRSRRLERVVIESTTIETEQLAHTLRHTPFLGQRYVHQMSFRIVSAASVSSAAAVESGDGFPSLDSLQGLDPVSNKARQVLIFSSSQACCSLALFNSWATEVKQNLPYEEVFYINTEAGRSIDSLQNALGLR